MIRYAPRSAASNSRNARITMRAIPQLGNPPPPPVLFWGVPVCVPGAPPLPVDIMDAEDWEERAETKETVATEMDSMDATDAAEATEAVDWTDWEEDDRDAMTEFGRAVSRNTGVSQRSRNTLPRELFRRGTQGKLSKRLTYAGEYGFARLSIVRDGGGRDDDEIKRKGLVVGCLFHGAGCSPKGVVGLHLDGTLVFVLGPMSYLIPRVTIEEVDSYVVDLVEEGVEGAPCEIIKGLGTGVILMETSDGHWNSNHWF